jgi:hypothetical protein
MIMSAGMLMNEAGLVPSIIELMSRDPKASAIPMAVAAFIALSSAGATDPSVLQDSRARSADPAARARPRDLRIPAQAAANLPPRRTPRG